jgi:hypothetical protein
MFDDFGKLFKRIEIIKKEYARPVAKQYAYLDVNGESYFDNVAEDGINVRLIEQDKNKEGRQIIINTSEQIIKIRL